MNTKKMTYEEAKLFNHNQQEEIRRRQQENKQATTPQVIFDTERDGHYKITNINHRLGMLSGVQLNEIIIDKLTGTKYVIIDNNTLYGGSKNFCAESIKIRGLLKDNTLGHTTLANYTCFRKTGIIHQP